MKRLFIALVAFAVIGSGAFALAASLTVSSNNLSAGGAEVDSCDTDGVNVSYTVAYVAPNYEVANVTVNNITDPACNGYTLYVTLSSSTNASLAGMSAVHASGTTEVFNFAASNVKAADVENVDIALTKP